MKEYFDLSQILPDRQYTFIIQKRRKRGPNYVNTSNVRKYLFLDRCRNIFRKKRSAIHVAKYIL